MYKRQLEGLADGEDLTKLKDLHSQMEAIEAQKAEDVYKRQVLEYLTAVMRGQHREQTLQLVGDGVQTITDIDAVSYTHLDVYKRQEYTSSYKKALSDANSNLKFKNWFEKQLEFLKSI